MDQAKVYWAQFVKYHFWVFSVVAVVTGVAGWFLATNALADAYKMQISKIEGAFGKAQGVLGVTDHPNASFEQGVDALLDAPGVGLKAKVLAAWNMAYDEQKNEILKWPEEMQEDFLREMQALGPAGEIPIEYRERYQNYVKNEFPRLVKIVDADPGDPTGGRKRQAAEVNADGVEEFHDYKVIWRDQSNVDQTLEWNRMPSSKEMRYLQENLWVYQTLLRIIARVNDKATGHYNATIKEIITLQIGRGAAEAFQSAMSSNRLMAPPAEGAPGGAASAPTRGSTSNSRGRAGVEDAVQEDGRYVDAKGAPVAGAGDVPEYKRMPVFMQLLIDQREVPRLLVECANSPLPVEVKLVRINPTGLRSGGVSAFAGGGKGGHGAAGAHGADAADLELNPYQLPVEVYGIIYIFNPPDLTKLNVAETAEAPPAEKPADDAEKPADSAEPPAADGGAAMAAAQGAKKPAGEEAEKPAAPAGAENKAPAEENPTPAAAKAPAPAEAAPAAP